MMFEKLSLEKPATTVEVQVSPCGATKGPPGSGIAKTLVANSKNAITALFEFMLERTKPWFLNLFLPCFDYECFTAFFRGKRASAFKSKRRQGQRGRLDCSSKRGNGRRVQL